MVGILVDFIFLFNVAFIFYYGLPLMWLLFLYVL